MKQVKINLHGNEFYADEVSEKQMDKLVDLFVSVSKQDMAVFHSAEPLDSINCQCNDTDFFDKSEDDDDEDDGHSPFDEYFDDDLSDVRPRPRREEENTPMYSSQQEDEDYHSPFGEAFGNAMLKQMDKRGAVGRPFKLDPTNLVDPIEEVNDDYAQQQDFYQTGIKYRNLNGRENIPHYRCRYECPVCDTKGNHYIPKDTPQVTCHTCKAQLEVEEATKLGLPNRDEWGNFYLANDIKEKAKK